MYNLFKSGEKRGCEETGEDTPVLYEENYRES